MSGQKIFCPGGLTRHKYAEGSEDMKGTEGIVVGFEGTIVLRAPKG